MILLTFILVSLVACTYQLENVTVEITNGKLIGEQRGHYYAFEGIPYAKAPVGKRRFKSPKLYTKEWSEPRPAKKIGAICLQWVHFKFEDEDKLEGSEDCLFINVYTPSLNAEEKMPVFVYIHGGAFMFGHGDVHGPELITTRPGILVNLNYRLGPLGFLSTEDEVVSGNMGLKDQVEALKWVQKNIAAFGGDPEQVTLTGFSAGGASVHYHILSPVSKGLYKNGISHSGSALNPWAFMEKGRERAEKLADIVGCPTGETKAMVDCLKEKPAEDIVRAVKQFQPWLYNPFSPFAPTVEPKVRGAFLTERPIDILNDGNFQKLPWIVSATQAEGLYPAGEFLRRDEYLPYIDEHWNEVMPLILHYTDTIDGQRMDKVSQKIREHYLKDSAVNREIFSKFVDAISDRMYNYGLSQAARAHSSVAPTFFYHFRYKTAFGVGEFMSGKENFDFGVAHGEDIHLLYSSFFRQDEHPFSAEERRMSELLLDMYYSFARDGVPTLGEYEVPKVEFSYQKVLKHVCIDGPDSVATAVAEDFGEETFWDSLGFNENEPEVKFNLKVDMKNTKINML